MQTVPLLCHWSLIHFELNYNLTIAAKYWVFIYEPHYDHIILLDILFANSVKELYKYLELEEINHFDNQCHLQNLNK